MKTCISSISPCLCRLLLRLLFPLLLLTTPAAPATDLAIQTRGSSQNLAFAQYIASLQRRDPFREAGPVLISIEASLPELHKRAFFLAVRQRGHGERNEYEILLAVGDGTVADEVIARYFALHEQIDDRPFSSVAITPANYHFRFAGEVKTGGTSAYMYRVSPRKTRPGLIAGQLWMDSTTGAEVLLSGHLVERRLVGGHVDFVRDTKVLNGSVCERVTHVAFRVPGLGRSELVITENTLSSEGDDEPPMLHSHIEPIR